MYNLPNPIKELIYSFDPTYYYYYYKVLEEILYVTSLWEIKFNKGLAHRNFSTESNLSLLFAREYTNFWNIHLLNEYKYMYNDYQEYIIQGEICYPRSLMDYTKKNIWFHKIFHKIKKNTDLKKLCNKN